MSSIDPIKKENRELISSLTGKEKIGIDDQGRLYKIQKNVISSVFNLFSKNASKVGQVITQYALESLEKKEFHDIKKGGEAYQKLQAQLSKIQYIDKTNKMAIAFAWHNQRITDLVKAGVRKEVAEATVVAEMIVDPNISENFKESIRPDATVGGTSGSYFLKNRNGDRIGIFKPQDEEVFMPNNIKGREAKYNPNDVLHIGPRAGHLQGTSWKKEIAAWIIDQGKFANVPYTTSISIPFPINPSNKNVVIKNGSFQLYAPGITVERLTSDAIEEIPIKEIQKIAIFDLMVGNSDRNFGNILYDKTDKVITPIDHGLILLDSIDWLETKSFSEANAYWIPFPHVRQPIEDHLKNWVLSYDILNKSQDLRNAQIPEESIREHMLRMHFLKEGISQGFTIYDLAMLSMQTSENADEPTWLDRQILKVKYSLIEEERFKDIDLFFANFQKNVTHELSEMKKEKDSHGK